MKERRTMKEIIRDKASTLMLAQHDALLKIHNELAAIRDLEDQANAILSKKHGIRQREEANRLFAEASKLDSALARKLGRFLVSSYGFVSSHRTLLTKEQREALGLEGKVKKS